MPLRQVDSRNFKDVLVRYGKRFRALPSRNRYSPLRQARTGWNAHVRARADPDTPRAVPPCGPGACCGAVTMRTSRCRKCAGRSAGVTDRVSGTDCTRPLPDSCCPEGRSELSTVLSGLWPRQSPRNQTVANGCTRQGRKARHQADSTGRRMHSKRCRCDYGAGDVRMRGFRKSQAMRGLEGCDQAIRHRNHETGNKITHVRVRR